MDENDWEDNMRGRSVEQRKHIGRVRATLSGIKVLGWRTGDVATEHPGVVQLSQWLSWCQMNLA
ncbi:unnamed protein product [Penicillium bialowiezense]